MKNILFVFLCLMLGIQANAQSDTDNPFYGLRSGVKITNVEQISKMIIQEVNK